MDAEQLIAAAEARGLAALGWLRRIGTYVWQRDQAFLLVVTAVNLFFCRRTWNAGIWADNDSVCHYAYLRHLLEEFYPATGTFMGFTPKYNMGLPYLVYNTPPGVYVLSALVSKATGLSALAALKVVIVSAFLSVPLLGFALARTFEEEKTDFPKYAALALSLFSSELFGLEFYFKNGMLNPALAVPMLIGTLIAFRRAQLSPLPRCLRWLAIGAVLFALTIFTHVLSAYMLCLALLAFVLGNGIKTMGASVLKLGVMVLTGGLLVAEWLYPSLAFAAKGDAAYTWSRDWQNTLSDFFDGSLFSSYPVGFFASFITQSNVSIVAIVAGGLALFYLLRRFNGGVGGAAMGFLLALMVALGPTVHFGISILPLYDRLLWYRFVTLAAFMWLMVAAYGAYRFADRKFRYYPLNVVLLAMGAGWAGFVMTTRAVKIQTAETYPQFEKSTDDVASWLREHGDKRGRVFSEFLGQGAVQAISVNYPRHMIPILSGFDEAGGWIYENNPASQALMKKGPFWFNPIPMIDQAVRYNVKYIVAGSPQFIHALAADPRWSQVVETPDLVLFERVAYTPALAEGPGVAATVSKRAFLPGGGFLYDIDVTSDVPLPAPSPLLVKTNYAPAWSATLGGKPAKIRSTEDGLLEVELPVGTVGNQRLELTWSIDELRAKGRKGTLLGVALAGLLLVLSFRKTAGAFERVPARLVQGVGVGGLVVALLLFAWRARKFDLEDVGGFGVAGGMSPTVMPGALAVGAYYDEQATQPIHVLPGAWSPRGVTPAGEPSRTLLGDGRAAVVTLGEKSTLTIRGTGSESRDLDVVLVDELTSSADCTLHGRLGEPMPVAQQCLGDKHEDVLGYHRALRILAPGKLAVSAIEVSGGIVYAEAESLRNTVYDGGCEAFYSTGSAIEYFPQNGVLMTADPPYHCPVDLVGDLDLTPGVYDVWVLARALHPRFRMTRADLSMDVGGQAVGTFDGVTHASMAFWDRDARYEWAKLGRTSVSGRSHVVLHLKRKLNAAAGFVDVDTLAFEPR